MGKLWAGFFLVGALIVGGAGGSGARAEGLVDLGGRVVLPGADEMAIGRAALGGLMFGNEPGVAALRDSDNVSVAAVNSAATVVPVTMAPSGVDAFSLIADVFDCQDVDFPSFQASVVHMQAPTGNVQPFASVARDVTEIHGEEAGRLGYGAGTHWAISPSADFGTEVLVFPRDVVENDADRTGMMNLLGDMQWLARLEVRF